MLQSHHSQASEAESIGADSGAIRLLLLEEQRPAMSQGILPKIGLLTFLSLSVWGAAALAVFVAARI